MRRTRHSSPIRDANHVRRRIVAFVTLAAAMCAAAPAFADDDAVARAAVLTREAETALAAGKVSEACGKLAQSQALDPRGSTLLDLALCREKEGRIGTAYKLFEAAEKLANTEKRADRAATAKQRRNALFAKLPRVTVTVPGEATVPGLEVRVGLASDPLAQEIVPISEWGKAIPADPGDLRATASAPGKATWEEKFNLKQGQKKSVTVPPLAVGTPEVRPPDPVVEVKKTPPKVDGPTGVKEPVPDTEPPKPTGPFFHEGGRVVFDIGLLAGGELSLILKGPLAELSGTQYIYQGNSGNEFLASCGNTSSVPGAGSCEAVYDPALGFLGGAQIFLGYAISDTFQLGGRGFFGASFPLGYAVHGGPSVSFEVAKPLWLGFTAIVGTSQLEATVTGGRGSVPQSLRGSNGGKSAVVIPVEDLAGTGSGGEGFDTGTEKAGAFGGFEVGGSFEITIVLVDNPTDDASSGALLLNFWPGGVWSPNGGGALFLPAGLGYRFY